MVCGRELILIIKVLEKFLYIVLIHNIKYIKWMIHRFLESFSFVINFRNDFAEITSLAAFHNPNTDILKKGKIVFIYCFADSAIHIHLWIIFLQYYVLILLYNFQYNNNNNTTRSTPPRVRSKVGTMAVRHFVKGHPSRSPRSQSLWVITQPHINCIRTRI